MEEPMTNINVTMTIPSQKYTAASMEIMDGYGDVVKEAGIEKVVREAILSGMKGDGAC